MTFSVTKNKNAKFLAKQLVYHFMDEKIDFYVMRNATTVHIKKGVLQPADYYKIPHWFKKSTKKVTISQYIRGKLKNKKEVLINQ